VDSRAAENDARWYAETRLYSFHYYYSSSIIIFNIIIISIIMIIIIIIIITDEYTIVSNGYIEQFLTDKIMLLLETYINQSKH